jgi:hypothetical protein
MSLTIMIFASCKEEPMAQILSLPLRVCDGLAR